MDSLTQSSWYAPETNNPTKKKKKKKSEISSVLLTFQGNSPCISQRDEKIDWRDNPDYISIIRIIP
jgi:hypothetical protein